MPAVSDLNRHMISGPDPCNDLVVIGSSRICTVRKNISVICEAGNAGGRLAPVERAIGSKAAVLVEPAHERADVEALRTAQTALDDQLRDRRNRAAVLSYRPAGRAERKAAPAGIRLRPLAIVLRAVPRRNVLRQLRIFFRTVMAERRKVLIRVGGKYHADGGYYVKDAQKEKNSAFCRSFHIIPPYSVLRFRFAL